MDPQRHAPAPTALEIDQIDRLVRTTPVAWTLSTLGALICYFQFNESFAGSGLDWWLGTFCAIATLRLITAVLVYRTPRSMMLIRWWLASTLLHAAQWGLLSVVLQRPGSPQAESVLHITLVAIAMGGVVRLPGFRLTLIAHVGLVLGPLILRDLWTGSAHHALLAFLVFLIGIYALVSGRNQSLALREIHVQRQRNEELILALQRENERSETARSAAEAANASRTRFFAAANHDLRQPLHAMRLLSQTLVESGQAVDVPAVSAHLVECVEGMTRVIDDLLEITRLDVGNVTPQWSTFLLDDLVRECCRPHEPLALAKGLRLEIDVPRIAAHCDRALLARVLTNLASNAIRYTDQGSVRIACALTSDAGHVWLDVEDTGIGIDEEDLPRIFEEFYQVGNPARDRHQGLGLGLATVKRLSDLLSLDVSVMRSAPGKGSVFSLKLKRVPMSEAAADAPDAGTSAGALLPGHRVLVIEDDADSRTALAGLLRSWGCDVQATADVAASLAQVRAGFRPDALVVDLRLPDGASGIDALRDVRALLAEEVPAVMVTGDAGSAHMRLAQESGLTVMVKPVRPVQLRAFLGQVFARDHAQPVA
ncbi:MAG: hybrid sensor histidine kinase/response regulator [Hydrogenophaga sp.]|jgi:two-component system, sensor histidine kinase|nr:hybrid sensor histidine kinase/response regulator [Hydrogenophaga sp.]